MKRYDLFSVSDYQTDSRFEVHESEEGYYVPYHEIQSDRALLEEAVKWLEFTRSKIDYCHTVITNKDIENNMTIGQLDTFLARAKEVLK